MHINANPSYDIKKVQRDIESRLHTFVNPLTGGSDGKGWTFGRDLFVSDIMAILLTVRGVNFVRSVKMFPINYENRQFTRGAETQEIPVVAHGVVVSYQHNIHLD